VMTPALAKMFNILRAIDVPYRIGHSWGAQLGNGAHTAGGTVFQGMASDKYVTATVDQVMAHSPSFYTTADLESKLTQRSFCAYGGSHSFNFTSPSTKTGKVVQQPYQRNNQDFFDYFFKPGSAFNNVSAFIIDRTKSSYDRLKKDPRLSKGDLARLNQHVERMFEIERKMLVIGKLAAPPPAPTFDSDAYLTHHSFPHDPVENKLYCHLMNDVIVAAFTAGVSRAGTWSQGIAFADQIINNWHGNVAHHGYGNEESQKWTLGWHQGTFEHIMVDLASKLEKVTMQDGKTLLDHSLITFTSEAGQYTHHTGCVNFPVVMAGGAGGFFNTGMFVDFGNKQTVYTDLDKLIAENPKIQAESPGLYHNQWLANVLLSMGVPASEWEIFTEFTGDGPSKSAPTKGYGFHFVDSKKAADYTLAKAVMGDKLPVITS
jgi:hypothetical protein